MRITRTISMITLFALVSIPGVAGTVSGTVIYEGPLPPLNPLKMSSDPVCERKHAEDVMPELLVLGDGQTMGNIFVWVKSGLPKKEYPPVKETFVVTQEGCIYSPHVFAVRVSQPIKVLNPDGTPHNVHVVAKINKELNLMMASDTLEIPIQFDLPEQMVKFECNIHPWMKAHCAVMDHPYYAVTDKDGKFSIPDLPAGTYEIAVWHEVLKEMTATIEVSASGEVSQDFTFQHPSLKKKK